MHTHPCSRITSHQACRFLLHSSHSRSSCGWGCLRAWAGNRWASPVSPAMRQLVRIPAGLQAALGRHRAGPPWQASVNHTVLSATWLASPGPILLPGWVDGDSCWCRNGEEVPRWSLLGQWPEPAVSREFTGDVFRKKSLLCLWERPGVSTEAGRTSLSARSPQRLLLRFLRHWGKESSLPSRLALRLREGSVVQVLELSSPSPDGPTVLL